MELSLKAGELVGKIHDRFLELLNQCPKGILFQGDVLNKDVSKECDRFIKGELDDEL